MYREDDEEKRRQGGAAYQPSKVPSGGHRPGEDPSRRTTLFKAPQVKKTQTGAYQRAQGKTQAVKTPTVTQANAAQIQQALASPKGRAQTVNLSAMNQQDAVSFGATITTDEERDRFFTDWRTEHKGENPPTLAQMRSKADDTHRLGVYSDTRAKEGKKIETATGEAKAKGVQAHEEERAGMQTLETLGLLGVDGKPVDAQTASLADIRYAISLEPSAQVRKAANAAMGALVKNPTSRFYGESYEAAAYVPTALIDDKQYKNFTGSLDGRFDPTPGSGDKNAQTYADRYWSIENNETLSDIERIHYHRALDAAWAQQLPPGTATPQMDAANPKTIDDATALMLERREAKRGRISQKQAAALAQSAANVPLERRQMDAGAAIPAQETAQKEEAPTMDAKGITPEAQAAPTPPPSAPPSISPTEAPEGAQGENTPAVRAQAITGNEDETFTNAGARAALGMEANIAAAQSAQAQGAPEGYGDVNLTDDMAQAFMLVRSGDAGMLDEATVNEFDALYRGSAGIRALYGTVDAPLEHLPPVMLTDNFITAAIMEKDRVSQGFKSENVLGVTLTSYAHRALDDDMPAELRTDALGVVMDIIIGAEEAERSGALVKPKSGTIYDAYLAQHPEMKQALDDAFAYEDLIMRKKSRDARWNQGDEEGAIQRVRSGSYTSEDWRQVENRMDAMPRSFTQDSDAYIQMRRAGGEMTTDRSADSWMGQQTLSYLERMGYAPDVNSAEAEMFRETMWVWWQDTIDQDARMAYALGYEDLDAYYEDKGITPENMSGRVEMRAQSFARTLTDEDVAQMEAQAQGMTPTYTGASGNYAEAIGAGVVHGAVDTTAGYLEAVWSWSAAGAEGDPAAIWTNKTNYASRYGPSIAPMMYERDMRDMAERGLFPNGIDQYVLAYLDEGGDPFMLGITPQVDPLLGSALKINAYADGVAAWAQRRYTESAGKAFGVASSTSSNALMFAVSTAANLMSGGGTIGGFIGMMAGYGASSFNEEMRTQLASGKDMRYARTMGAAHATAVALANMSTLEKTTGRFLNNIGVGASAAAGAQKIGAAGASRLFAAFKGAGTEFARQIFDEVISDEFKEGIAWQIIGGGTQAALDGENILGGAVGGFDPLAVAADVVRNIPEGALHMLPIALLGAVGGGIGGYREASRWNEAVHLIERAARTGDPRDGEAAAQAIGQTAQDPQAMRELKDAMETMRAGEIIAVDMATDAEIAPTMDKAMKAQEQEQSHRDNLAASEAAHDAGVQMVEEAQAALNAGDTSDPTLRALDDGLDAMSKAETGMAEAAREAEQKRDEGDKHLGDAMTAATSKAQEQMAQERQRAAQAEAERIAQSEEGYKTQVMHGMYHRITTPLVILSSEEVAELLNISGAENLAEFNDEYWTNLLSSDDNRIAKYPEHMKTSIAKILEWMAGERFYEAKMQEARAAGKSDVEIFAEAAIEAMDFYRAEIETNISEEEKALEDKREADMDAAQEELDKGEGADIAAAAEKIQSAEESANQADELRETRETPRKKKRKPPAITAGMTMRQVRKAVQTLSQMSADIYARGRSDQTQAMQARADELMAQMEAEMQKGESADMQKVEELGNEYGVLIEAMESMSRAEADDPARRELESRVQEALDEAAAQGEWARETQEEQAALNDAQEELYRLQEREKTLRPVFTAITNTPIYLDEQQTADVLYQTGYRSLSSMNKVLGLRLTNNPQFDGAVNIDGGWLDELLTESGIPKQEEWETHPEAAIVHFAREKRAVKADVAQAKETAAQAKEALDRKTREILERDTVEEKIPEDHRLDQFANKTVQENDRLFTPVMQEAARGSYHKIQHDEFLRAKAAEIISEKGVTKAADDILAAETLDPVEAMVALELCERFRRMGDPYKSAMLQGMVITKLNQSANNAGTVLSIFSRLQKRNAQNAVADMISEAAAFNRRKGGVAEAPTADSIAQLSLGRAEYQPYSQNAVSLPTIEPGMAKLASDVKKRSGIDVYAANMPEDIRGFYSRKRGVIVINERVGAAGARNLVALHELTHYLEESEGYAAYAEAALKAAYGDNYAESNGYKMDAGVIRSDYEARGEKLTDDLLKKELVAAATEMIVSGDETFLRGLMTGGKGGFALRVMRGIDKFLAAKNARRGKARKEYAALTQARKNLSSAVQSAAGEIRQRGDAPDAQASIKIQQLGFFRNKRKRTLGYDLKEPSGEKVYTPEIPTKQIGLFGDKATEWQKPHKEIDVDTSKYPRQPQWYVQQQSFAPHAAPLSSELVYDDPMRLANEGGIERESAQEVIRRVEENIDALAVGVSTANRWRVPLNDFQMDKIKQFNLENVSIPGNYHTATVKQRQLMAVMATPQDFRGEGMMTLTQQLETMEESSRLFKWRRQAVVTNADVLFETAMARIVEEAEFDETGRPLDYEAQVAYGMMCDAKANIFPVETTTKWNTLRYTNMLSSPVTAVKAHVGNVITRLIEEASMPATILGDIIAERKTGVRRYAALTAEERAQGREAYGRRFYEVTADLLLHGTSTSRSRRYDGTGKDGRGRVFQNPMQETLRRLVEFGVDASDQAHIERMMTEHEAMIRRLGDSFQIADAKTGVMRTPTAEEIHEIAFARAMNTFYHDDSSLSKQLGEAYKIPFFGTILHYKIPFNKTTSNTAIRALEVSPLGLAKSILYDYVFASMRFNEDGSTRFNQEIFARNFGRGLTGSALGALGIILSAMGVIKFGRNNEEEYARSSLMGALGVPYGMYIDIGGTMHEITFTNPVASSFAFGAVLYDKLKDGEGVWNALGAAGVHMIDEFAESSYLGGLQDIFRYSEGIADAAIDTLASTPGAIIQQTLSPAAVRALAKAMDPYARDTYSQNPVMQAINESFIQCWPVLRQTLPVRQDVRGEPMTQHRAYQKGGTYANAVLNFADSFLTPTATYGKESDATFEALLDLSDRTGEASFLPGAYLSGSQYTASIPKSRAQKLGFDGAVSIPLTDEQKRRANRFYGQILFGGASDDLAREMGFTGGERAYVTLRNGGEFYLDERFVPLDTLIGSSEWSEMTEEEQIDAIKDAKGYAKEFTEAWISATFY